jgi:dihydrodipicolinate synthase/N-acetylneuraminate lyase
MSFMRREAIMSAVLAPDELPLWAPLLTFYHGREPDIDAGRIGRHVASLGGAVKQFMLAGSTGDGWEMSSSQFAGLLELAASGELGNRPSGERRDKPVGEGNRLLIATLRPTTAEVLALVARVHDVAGTSGTASISANVARLRELGWVGLCVAPPVGSGIAQEEIKAHYQVVCAAANLPLAVYQIPQVTGCSLEPRTLAELVTEHEEIILCKDSSGTDELALTGAGGEELLMIRGAEGDYAEMLRPLGGPYDGLLLSSANVFGPELRLIVAAAFGGRADDARRLARELGARVARLFGAVDEGPGTDTSASGAAADEMLAGEVSPGGARGGEIHSAGVPIGNAFANVNRAVDHILAHGLDWAGNPLPLLCDGSRLPPAYLEPLAAILAEAGAVPSAGYLEV